MSRSRYIQQIIADKEQNLIIDGDHVEYNTTIINGEKVDPNEFIMNGITLNEFGLKPLGPSYQVTDPLEDTYVPVERIPRVYDVGTPGAPISDFTYDEPMPYTKGRIAVVQRKYKEAIFDYSQENLTALEQTGAKVYAKFRNGTFREVQWSEVFDPHSRTGAAAFNIAEIAEAHNQHFWLDTNGAHVTSDVRASWEDEYAERNHGTLAAPTIQNPWHNILLNSLGIMLRRGLINLVGIAKDNISFYDGTANDEDNITATFGTGGAQIGKNTESHVTITSEGVSCYDSNGDLLPLRASNVEFGNARIGHLSVGYASILNGMIDSLTVNDLTTMHMSAGDIVACKGYIGHLESGTITANELQALEGFVENFSSLRITTDYLAANYATFEHLESNYATISHLESDYIDSDEIAATYATISQLESDYIDADAIAAAYATISALEADEANIEALKALSLAALYADIDSLTADEIDALNLNAINAAIQNLETDNFTTENLTAITALIDTLRAHRITTDILEANYADIGLANVNNAWIENGVIKNEAVTSAQIQGVSANKITAGEINADNIIVRNLQAANLKVGRLNGNPVIGGYEVISTSLSGYSSKNPVNEGWYEYVNNAYVLSQDTSVRNGVVYYKTADRVDLYDQAAIDQKFSDVDARIDSQIETWTGTAVPLLTNYPASQWDSNTRADHVGDIYYVINAGNQYDGFTYRFAYDNTQQSYKWVLIRDNAVTDAISRIVTAEGDIGTLKTFQSDTETWINETDEGLETIRENHTSLEAVVDKTIVESTQLWFSKANTTAPGKPTAVVTSDSTAGNAWRTVVPAYNASYPNYYYCYQWKYADGTYGWSAVTRDIAMGESQSVARTADATAKANIKSSVQLWFTKANATAPAAPTAQVASTATNGNVWTTVVPTYNASYPNYFYCWQYQKGDNSYSWSPVVYDRATTENQQNSHAALTGLSTKVESTVFNNLVDTVGEHSSTITSLSTKVENLKIGGRNLLQKTADWSYGLQHGTKTSETYMGLSVATMTGDNTNNFRDIGLWGESGYLISRALEPNKEYTLSFWAKASVDTTAYSFLFSTYTESGYNSSGNTTTAADGSIANSLTTSWNRYWITWKTKSTGAPTRTICLRLNKGNTATVYICGAKLEEGNKATDWTPAPEDMATASSVTTVTNTVNEVKQTANSNHATIQELQTITSNLETAKNYYPNYWRLDRYSKPANQPAIPVEDNFIPINFIETIYIHEDNFNANLALGDQYIARIQTFVYMSTITTMTLTVNHDDGAAYYINDTLVYSWAGTSNSNKSSNGESALQITVQFNAGWNKILILLNEITGSDFAYFVGIKPSQFTNAVKVQAELDPYDDTTVRRRISSVEQDLDGFRTTVSETYATSNSLNNAISNVVVGGRNLLLNSDQQSRNILDVPANYNAASFDISDYGHLISGETYTITVEGINNGRKGLCPYIGGGTHGIPPWKDISNKTNVKESWTFVASSNQASAYQFVMIFASMIVGTNGSNTISGTFTCTHVKLERGNKATDWSPAPEDTYNMMNHYTVNWDTNYGNQYVGGEADIIPYDPCTRTVLTSGDPWFYWNNLKRIIKGGNFNPNSAIPYHINIYFVCRLGSATATEGTVYPVWYANSKWNYLSLGMNQAVSGNTVADWTWNENWDIVLASCVEPSGEGQFTDCKIYDPPITVKQIGKYDVTASGTQANLNTEINQRKALYATSATAAGTAAKDATCSNFVLYTGARVSVTFTNANTAATPTLNVNGTGAKQIRSYVGVVLAEGEYKWAAGSTLLFVYDGTYWRLQDSGSTKRLVTAETKIDQNATAITLRATKTEVSDAIDDIQIGGRNLLKGSKNWTYGLYHGTKTNDLYLGLVVAKLNKPESSYLDTGAWHGLQLKPDTEYTLSFYAKADSNGQILSYLFPSYTASGYNSSNYTTTGADGIISSNLTTEWDRYWITWKTKTTGAPPSTIAARIESTSTVGCVYICGVKLEEGNKATDWSPAPEDSLGVLADYTPLKWLQGGSNARIDTGLKNSGWPIRMRTVVEFASGLPTKEMEFWGNYSASQTGRFAFGTSGGKWFAYSASTAYSSISVSSGVKYDVTAEFTGGSCNIRVGTDYFTLTTGTSTPDGTGNTIGLLNGRGDADYWPNTYARIYEAQFYKQNVLVFDAVPVKRNSDGVLGVYDFVTETFLPKQGDGNFTAGPEITWTETQNARAKNSIYISTAELKVTNDNISSKVSTTDYTGATIASKINQSADSVKIQAKHVEIDGTAIFGNTAFQTGLNNALDNIKIGGRNLLLWTENLPKGIDTSVTGKDGITTWNPTSMTSLTETADGLKLSTTGASTECFGIPLATNGSVSNNEDVILSFEARGNITAVGQFYWIQASGSNIAIGNWVNGSSTISLNESNWTKFSINVKHASANVRICTKILLFYNTGSSNNGKWIEIKKKSLKLEKGNKATDWSPAPEDVTETSKTLSRPNLISYFQTSLDDAKYWAGVHVRNGSVSNAEGLHAAYNVDSYKGGSGWAHITLDSRSSAGNTDNRNCYMNQCIGSGYLRNIIKPGGTYTWMIEVSDLTLSGTGKFHVRPSINHDTLDVFNIYDQIITSNGVYYGVVTAKSDFSGLGGYDTRGYSYVTGDTYADYYLRVSLYEGVYEGEWKPYVPLDKIDAIAEALNGFTILWNYSDFLTSNQGEGYICKWDPVTSTPSDENGWVVFNGVKRIITKQMINPNTVIPYNRPVYVVCRLSSATATSGTNYMVFYDGGWKYAIIPTPTAVESSAWAWNYSTDIVLGKFVETGSEVPFIECEVYNPPRNARQVTASTITAGSANELAAAVNTNLSTEINQRKAAYGTCSTAAGTQTKDVVCANFEYVAGNSLTVYFSTANSYAAGAVNLNVNGKGAKAIIASNATTSATNQFLWGAGAYITFRYTGSAFMAINEPRVWYGLSSTAAATAAKTDTTACTGAVICKGTSVVLGMTYDNTNTAPTLNIQSTGAKAVYIGPASTRPTKANGFSWLPDTTVKFDFDGSAWRIGGDTYIKGDHIITGTIDASVVDVTNIKAGNINSGTISADRIGANSITSSKIASSAIIADKIAANAITADKIAANAVTAGKIAAGTITSDKLSTKTLTVGNFTDAAASSILNSNIQIGGRNLIGNTGNPTLPLGLNSSGTFGVVGKYNSPDSEFSLENYDSSTKTIVLTSTVTGNRGVGWFTKAGEIRAGETYTFSCRVKTSIAASVHMHTAWRNGSATAGYTGWTNTNALTTAANTWTNYVATFIPSSDAQLTWEFYVAICFSGNTSGITMRVAHAKLEQGNKATDWTPAPEDTNALINTAQTAANNAAKTATDYVAAISGGVKIFPSGGASTNYLSVTSNGAEVIKGGSTVASFGEKITLGSTFSSKAVIENTSFKLLDYWQYPLVELKSLATYNNGYTTISRYFCVSSADRVSGKRWYLGVTAVNTNYTVKIGSTTQSLSEKTTTYFTLSNIPVAQSIITVSNISVESTDFDLSSFTLGTFARSRSTYEDGLGSFATGVNHVASGQFSFCANEQNIAMGDDSFACGSLTEAYGYACFTAGSSTHAYGSSSTAMGSSNIADGSRIFVCGYSNRGYYSDQFICGKYNSNSSADIFEVGNGEGNSSRGNAFRVTTSNTAYVGSTQVTSDERVKTDISEIDIDDAYEFISELKPKSYKKFNRPELGFIAQDVEKLVYGDILVDESPNFGYEDFKNLSYEGLIAPIVAVEQGLMDDVDDILNHVNILKAENDRLKEENKVLTKKTKALEQKNYELEERLARIESMLGIAH